MASTHYNFSKGPVKIALGDLRHKTVGKHSFFMPLGIGLIASYALSKLGRGNIAIRLYDDPDAILRDIDNWQPEVVALSNYCWNSELGRAVFRYAKQNNPQVVSVAGGPDFPSDPQECKQYLTNRPELDFYVCFEGEIAFANLLNKIRQGAGTEQLKSEPQANVMSIHPKTKGLISGPSMPRIVNMDEIPSPYLTGLMDQWFDGAYAPSIETSRGCPFTCGYCYTGSQECYRKIASFSVERVKKELTYMAERMTNYPEIVLAFYDANFGMYQRDEEIAEHISKLQDQFGWPNGFEVTTGKANYDRILRVSSLLKNKMHVSCSVQSLNPKTLEAISRRNAAIEEYRQINEETKKQNMGSISEMIVPMPEETKHSFFEGLRIVSNVIGVDRVIPYTTMLLKGTLLASRKFREKYQMKTKFRILPRQFSEYFGQKCFEIEEVCVATNTMSFEE